MCIRDSPTEVVGDVPVERIDATLATGAPEHLADAEADRGRHAIGGASGNGDRIGEQHGIVVEDQGPVSYTHLRAHETVLELVCRLLL